MNVEKESGTEKTHNFSGTSSGSISGTVRNEMNSALQKFASQDLLDVFLEMLTALRDEKEMRLIEIQHAIKTKDLNKLKSTAHSLRGSFLSLGIDSLAGSLMELEQQALKPKPDWDLMEKIHEQLSTGYRNFEKSCEHLL
ncbi:MAG: Hpt domain-containing protein [Silvanigrellaceae bacterium]